MRDRADEVTLAENSHDNNNTNGTTDSDNITPKNTLQEHIDNLGTFHYGEAYCNHFQHKYAPSQIEFMYENILFGDPELSPTETVAIVVNESINYTMNLMQAEVSDTDADKHHLRILTARLNGFQILMSDIKNWHAPTKEEYRQLLDNNHEDNHYNNDDSDGNNNDDDNDGGGNGITNANDGGGNGITNANDTGNNASNKSETLIHTQILESLNDTSRDKTREEIDMHEEY